MSTYDRRPIADRLRRARQQAGLTNVEIAHSCGVTPQAVGGWMRSGKISHRHIATVAGMTGVTSDWLLSGRGAAGVADTAPSYDLAAESRQLPATVPLISWVQAGAWCDVVDNLEPGEAEAWLHVDHNVGPNAFALTVRGDSMEPEFPDGARIIVDPAHEPTDGSYVIARLDDAMEATFKQLVIDGSRRYLKPLNGRYPVIAIEGPMTICGVVRSQSKTYL